MHIEIQVALNFVISYLYNKLPRRRVNIFGEELEKALRDKFQGHWYPEKPFKGSAFRCLKTGDPTDAVLDRAARESGVPIADILENLPNELSVWIDPGEVSYRIGEKGAVKILYSENSDNHEDNTSADREVNKTFNPEAQCFRPIDAVNSSMNSLSLSPKTSPQSGSSPHSASSSSPTAYKGSPNAAVNGAANMGGGGGGGGSMSSNAAFMQRHHVPLTFTTATFAQTKFGSTKLKTNSKRTNSSSYRMSPTEFSNYIKQRAMQQQQVHHHGHHHAGMNGSGAASSNHQFGAIGPVSPARSLSPNPLSLPMGNGANSAGTQNHADPFYFPNMAMGMYPPFNGHRNLFEAPHFPHAESNGFNGMGLNAAGNHAKFNNGYLEPHAFYGMPPHMGPTSPQPNGGLTAKNLELLNSKELQHNNNNNNNNNNINAKNNINAAAAGITVTINNGGAAAVGVNSNNANNSNDMQLSVSPIPALNLHDVGSSASLHGSNNAIASPTSAGSNASSACSSNNSLSNASSNSSAASSSASSTSSTSSASSGSSSAASNSATASSKLIDGLNSFYSNATGSTYQQLLVAN